MDFKKLAKEAGFNHLMGQVEELVSVMPVFAKMNKAYYDSLIEEGFNKEEALSLVKAHGHNIRGGGGKE